MTRHAPGTYLARTFPEFMTKGCKLAGSSAGPTTLMDLGNPDALQYLIDFATSAIEEYGIDVFRVDFNAGDTTGMSPTATLPCWRAADLPDRRGMTEVRAYVLCPFSLVYTPSHVVCGTRPIDVACSARSVCSIYLAVHAEQRLHAHSIHKHHLHLFFNLSASPPPPSGQTNSHVTSTCSIRTPLSPKLQTPYSQLTCLQHYTMNRCVTCKGSTDCGTRCCHALKLVTF
jgi:hypothetical protein